MAKYKLIIDSTVYLPKEVLDKHNISVASLNVIEGDNSYREVEVDNQFIFDKQDEGKSWTTSQPAPGEYLELYQEAFKEGYDKIFVSGLSKDISGTYQSSMLAKNMLDNPEDVYIFDTQLCAYGTEMIAFEIIDCMTSNMSFEDTIEKVNRLIHNSGQMFTVENLFSLVKGGRLSVAKAAIGTVLRVKPVIKVVEGKLKLVHNERTYKKLHKYIINQVKEQAQDYTYLHVYITNQYSPDSGEAIKEEIKQAFPDAKITYTAYLGPVFSVHVGRKGYGISWCFE
jgi:DegV family protein with EDD domain